MNSLEYAKCIVKGIELLQKLDRKMSYTEFAKTIGYVKSSRDIRVRKMIIFDVIEAIARLVGDIASLHFEFLHNGKKNHNHTIGVHKTSQITITKNHNQLIKKHSGTREGI